MSPESFPTAGTDSPLDWTDDGQPRSRLYGDVYFSAEDGLAETRAVFLEGCGLPDAWSGRRRFVVGELGFGTGLNIAALLDLWRRSRPPGGHLNIFSIEAYPITRDEAARALAHWPELTPVTQVLLARWPGRARGRHRVDLPDFGATLDLAVMDVSEALSGWQGRADAWFLDGFSPALNPAMWREEILALVAARSAPGARAATFTVAGFVRRGLAAAGFEVAKRPGFGRKRERLEARLPGAAADAPARTVAVIGAGIAGASLARAVRDLGAEAVVIDAAGPGAGASGNPAGLVTPRLDAGLGEAAGLFADAFRRATRLYDAIPGAVAAQGVDQLPGQPRDAERFARIAGADIFEAGSLALGDDGRLDQRTAQVVVPGAVLDAWLGDVLRADVDRIEPGGAGWRLMTSDGRLIAEADAVILAGGWGLAALDPDLPLKPVRGQASWTTGGEQAGAAAWGGYVLPIRGGILFGATHDRDDTGVDVRPEDHVRNLALLAGGRPGLAASLGGASLEGRASIRAVTPDRLPLAGALDRAGLFVLSGLGSRGLSLAPLLADHVAALALDAPSPLSAAGAALVDPARFAARAARRGRS